MARENKTKYAILGLMAEKPVSGYDIKKAVEESLGNFWSESYGQIYPVIKQLTEEGFARREAIETREGKPARHVYTITEKGREKLRSWLVEPAEPQKERVEVLLKLFFGKEVPVTENIKHLQRFKDENSALLEKYSAIEGCLKKEYVNEAGFPYWLSTVRCGIKVSSAMIEWCNETIEDLKGGSLE
ncbi:MAG: PadR family transcriptional regulator [Candidatus Eremiobacterota bacterium]